MTRIGRALRVAAVAVLTASAATWAGPPEVRFFNVGDVTPRSFRIVWISDLPATPDATVFEGPACLIEVLDARVNVHPTATGDPAVGPAAAERGVQLVQVGGLHPDTEYCVLTNTTSSETGETTSAPDAPLRVHTARRTARSAGPGAPVPFSNDLLRLRIARVDPAASTTGTLVLLRHPDALSPLASFVGDGIDDDANPATPTDLVLFDLNNLYDRGTHESLDLSGDGSEQLSAIVVGGPDGFSTVHARVVPADADLNEVRDGAPCPESPAGACDGRLGDANADGLVESADPELIRDHVVGLAGDLPCRVCADVTFDSHQDIRDALALAQALVGSRLLP
ncbi:MAG: hypothetical protein GY716_08055 [bacterium]|nr:hypothetical protein [bacterium]